VLRPIDIVMAGLVPAIRAFARGTAIKAWMPATPARLRASSTRYAGMTLRLTESLISGRPLVRTTMFREAAPATCVRVISFQLVTRFTSGRTKANVNPPAAVPNITGADTESQLSVALSASFHSCSLVQFLNCSRAERRHGSECRIKPS